MDTEFQRVAAPFGSSSVNFCTKLLTEANFGKGIEGRDLVYFTKLEHARSTGPADRAVQLGEVPRGQAKAGEQAHVIVSRTENLARYGERQRAGELAWKNPYHLSPLTNHKDTQRGVMRGGFERRQFSERVEQAFDQAFAYERPLVETFKCAYTMQHGTPEECAALQAQVLRQEQQRQQQLIQALAQIQLSASYQSESNVEVPQAQTVGQKRVRGPRL